jgi:hypothetical protein
MPSKSPAVDDIILALLQEGLEDIIGLVMKIFRACIALGYVPLSCRVVRAVFIPKLGHMSYVEAKYFHRISLTAFILKTLERLVDRHIKDEALVEYPLHSHQHAYQTGSTP